MVVESRRIEAESISCNHRIRCVSRRARRNYSWPMTSRNTAYMPVSRCFEGRYIIVAVNRAFLDSKHL